MSRFWRLGSASEVLDQNEPPHFFKPFRCFVPFYHFVSFPLHADVRTSVRRSSWIMDPLYLKENEIRRQRKPKRCEGGWSYFRSAVLKKQRLKKERKEQIFTGFKGLFQVYRRWDWRICLAALLIYIYMYIYMKHGKILHHLLFYS